QEVEQGPRQHHRGAPGDRLPVEGARQVGRRHLPFPLVRHLHIAAEGQGREHVFGLVALAVPRPYGFAEPDREAQHLDAEPARDDEVAEFMGDHQDADCHDVRQDADQYLHVQALAARAVRRRSQTSRARRSRFSTSSRVPQCRRGTSSKAIFTSSAMPVKERCPVRNAATATSLAAFSTTGAPSPASAACMASFRQGKASRSGGSKSRVSLARISKGSTPASSRSGQPSPWAMGVRMSGFESCASTDPSSYSTMEWITLWGCTTTSTCSGPVPNNQQASITSRPLFIMVAESTDILRPMFQVGWAQASAG